MTSSLGQRNCTMPELLKSLEPASPTCGTIVLPDGVSTQPCSPQKQIPFPRAFCVPSFAAVSSAASLVGTSKPLPAVLFLCKEQRNPRKEWGFRCFCSSHNFHDKGVFPDDLIYLEVRLLKLPHKSPSPIHTHFQ